MGKIAGGRAAVLIAGLMLMAASPPDPAPDPTPNAAWAQPGAGNPLLPAYAADPSIVQDQGRWYIFATIDPWGGDHVGLWQSANGRDWSFSQPAWPTKAAATSPTSGDSMVWAPSVVKGRDGRWWMYVSVGSEVWVGSAPSPAGPWADANHGKPLIPGNAMPGYHMIDAEAFIDDDGQAYLAWGSGLHWVNGHCFIARLAPDMVHLDGPPRDVTPAHYFEAPFLFKAAGRYYLTYSAGNTTTDTYQVRYATGPTPMGPFTEAPNSPILSTDAAQNIVSPGHHAIFRSGGQTYILYHRQALPWTGPRAETLRQVVVDRLHVRPDGLLDRVHPTHTGAAVAGWPSSREHGLPWRASGQGADAAHGPERAADNNFATLWRPGPDGMLTADLGQLRKLHRSLLRPEFADRPWAFTLEASPDGRQWQVIVPEQEQHGSPILVTHGVTARYLRLHTKPGQTGGLWEWVIE
ncbi:family 43 glycosylhydrolase [Novosphingobium terrae]|uniref:family 43 glycosylhydrolase n=1 Tax=Novosphingobium terrae TaxID=2726189 RepID=UPI001F14436A|nr:family 43 glycosylhydrolase [Novosphingobium terrae]